MGYFMQTTIRLLLEDSIVGQFSAAIPHLAPIFGEKTKWGFLHVSVTPLVNMTVTLLLRTRALMVYFEYIVTPTSNRKCSKLELAYDL
jgi:hypothetical protein